MLSRRRNSQRNLMFDDGHQARQQEIAPSPIEVELFSGRADLPHLMSLPYGQLPADEQAFIDGPVQQLLRLTTPSLLEQSRQLPPPLFDFMAEKGFFGLQIPTEFGGRPMSALGRSSVIALLTSHAPLLGSLVAAANEGAAELILAHGTDAQRAHYLPRLARGELLPCLASALPGAAGEDPGEDEDGAAAQNRAHAAGKHADGELFRTNDGALQVRLDFHRRQVPFAPLANLVVLICTVHDRAGMIGPAMTTRRSVALLDSGTPGLVIGHDGTGGQTGSRGSIIGHNVVVPACILLGGPTATGHQNAQTDISLVTHRAVTRAAVASATLQQATAAAAAYTTIRELQPPAQLGYLAAASYLFEAARVFSCTAQDRGQHMPGLPSQLAVRIADAADEATAHAGEVLAPFSTRPPRPASPINVTLAGTARMEHLLAALSDVPAGDTQQPDIIARAAAVSAHRRMTRLVTTLVLALARGSSRGYLFAMVPDAPATTRRYYRRLGWAAARLALVLALAARPRALTTAARHALAGELNGATTWQYLALAALRRFDADGRPAADLPLLHYSCRYALAEAEQCLLQSYRSVPGMAGAWLRWGSSLTRKLNPLSRPPTARLALAAAGTLGGDADRQQRVFGAIHLPDGPDCGFGALRHASRLYDDTRAIRNKLRQAQRAGRLDPGEPEAQLAQAIERMILTRTEGALLKAAYLAGRVALNGDAHGTVRSIAEASTAEPQAPATDEPSLLHSARVATLRQDAGPSY